MSEYIDSQLNILNTIFKNSIQKNGNNTSQEISKINHPLFSHQIATMHEMRKKMKNLLEGDSAFNSRIFSKLAILGSPENSGKTLTILGLLGNMEADNVILPKFHLLGQNPSSIFYCLENTSSEFIKWSNIIVVPNYLFSQWQNEIQTRTTLEFSFIDSKKSLLNINGISKNFLVSAKLYKNFYKFCGEKKIGWNMLVFDEVQNMYINNNDCEIPPATNFIWLVTSCWFPLIFRQSYLSFQELLHRSEDNLTQLVPEFLQFLQKNKNNNTFLKMESSAFFKNVLPYNNINRESLVVRCSEDFIQESMKSIRSMANISIQSKLCRPSVNLLYMRRFFQDNDIRADDMMPMIYNDLQISRQFQTDTNLQIYESEDCPICLDKPRFPVLSDCCRHTYCASCILKNTILRGICPLCRNNNNINNLRMLDVLEYRRIDTTLIQNKLETAYNIIVDNSDSNILVFSSHKNILYNLGDKLSLMNINSQIITNKYYNIKYKI